MKTLDHSTLEAEAAALRRKFWEQEQRDLAPADPRGPRWWHIALGLAIAGAMIWVAVT
jgi:hypothetical protein